MNRLVLILTLSTMAGCACGPEKQAAMEPVGLPAGARDAMTANAAPLGARMPATAWTGQTVPTIVMSDTIVNAIPIGAAEAAGSSGRADAFASDSPRADLMRCVTARANPLCRSMEQFARMDRFANPDNSESIDEEHS